MKLKSTGKNALDFALAYYLGRAALADPTCYFHIVSKDGGFDPLIEHLRSRHLHVYRHASCAELTFTWPGKKAAVSEPVVVKPVETIVAKKVAAKKVAKKAAAKKVAAKAVEKPDPEVAWMERVLKNFKEQPKARPKTRTSIINKVGSMINKPANGPEVLAVIARMEKAGKLKFGDNGVPEYFLE